jgi:membrane protein YdbS with pleckstrin-like domain
MKIISFKNFNDVPVCARVMWILELVLVLIGMVTLLLNAFEICSIKLCVSLAFIVAAQIINVFALNKYKDKMYK